MSSAISNRAETIDVPLAWSRGWFDKKMPSYQCRESHCGDKTIFRPSYLHNGISYTGKMTSLYWIKAQESKPCTSQVPSLQITSCPLINRLSFLYISDRHTNIQMHGYKQHRDDAVRVWWHHGTEGLSFASRDWIEMPVFHNLTLLVHQWKQLEFFKLSKCLKRNIIVSYLLEITYYSGA